MHSRSRASEPPVALLLGLIWLVAFSFLAWIALLSVMPYPGYGTALAIAAFILLPAIGLWCAAHAGARGGGFLLAIVLMVILLSDATLRGHSGGMDAQSGVKFGLWLSALLLLPWRIGIVSVARQDISTFSLLLFGLWAAATTAYSITPLYTFAAALGFLGMWVLAVVFATTFDIGRGLAWVTGALLVVLLLSLLLYVVAPDRAMVEHENGKILRLGGIVGSANMLGRTAALALLLAVLSCFYVSRRTCLLLLMIAVPASGACLYLSQSRTSMLALSAGLIVVLLRWRPWLLLPALLIGGGAAAFVLIFPDTVDALIAMVSRSGRASEVTTFTGRTDIWRFVISAIEKSPMLGYGFASTRELIPSGYATRYGWTAHSAHNLWLQVWVTTGAVGLVIILTNQFSALRSFVTKPMPVRDGVVTYVLLSGLFEPGPVGPSVSLLTFIWIWATALSLNNRSAAAP